MSEPAPARAKRNPTGQSVGPSVYKVPAGDDRERLVCTDCGYIHYENPKIVVGSVVTHGDRVLLCRRAIHSRRGYWTLPAGYLEARETVFDGARREALEEACAEIELVDLFAVYNIPRLSQVHLFFRAKLSREAVACGPESLEVRRFGWDEIPDADLAFPTTRWALAHFREIAGQSEFTVRTNPPGDWGDLVKG